MRSGCVNLLLWSLCVWKVVGNILILAALIDHGVVAGVGVDQGSKDTSSKTDSIFRELNESIDIDSLVTRERKKCKTTTRAVRISSARLRVLSIFHGRAAIYSLYELTDRINEYTPPTVSRGPHSVPVTKEAPIEVDMSKLGFNMLYPLGIIGDNANMTPSANNEAASVDNANQAHDTFYKFLGYMRGETATFLRSPRARTTTLVVPAILPYELTQGSYELDLLRCLAIGFALLSSHGRVMGQRLGSFLRFRYQVINV
ncbi:hypothetical protein GOBAR_DD19121 [Gossypium barbadense]|nr:hypothetical protein GOBAR_DD19121 [Gossypium barbadense]